MAANTPHVVQVERKPWSSNFSIEGYFARVRETLVAGGCDVVAVQLPHHSKGLLPRLANSIAARRSQRDVTHVTGDVHYAVNMCNPERTILTVLDCHALDRMQGWKRAVFKRFWYTMPLRHVKYVTVISEETKRVLLGHCEFDEARVIVIPVSVSPEFTPSVKAFWHQKPRILQVGTKPNKNLHRLILALRGLSCVLSIVGPLDAATKDLLSKNQIEFEHSERLTDEQIVQAYRDCDVIAFVSTYEGFGMPIVEGQSIGRPIVTSNISSMPEVAGSGACLVDPYDMESIRDGFQRVFEDPQYRQAIINAGLENAKRFDHVQICHAYRDLYQRTFAG